MQALKQFWQANGEGWPALPQHSLSAAGAAPWAVVLTLGAVLPLVLPAYFPSVDLWTHLAVSHVHRAVVGGNGFLADAYALSFGPFPYVGGYLLLALLGSVMDPVSAGAWSMVVCQLATVAGAWVLGAALGVSRQVRLLAFAAAFSMSLWYGFVSYALAMGPTLAVLGLCLVTQRTPTPRRVLAVAAGLVVVFFLHVQAWGPCGLLAGLAALAHRDWRLRLTRLAVCATPSLLLALWWLAGQAGNGGGTTQFVYGAPKDRLGLWQWHVLSAEGVLGLVAPAAVVGLAAMAWVWVIRRRTPLDGILRDTLALAVGAVVIHLALPKSLDTSAMPAWGISLRTGVFTTAVAMVCVEQLPVRWLNAAVPAMLMACLGMDAQAYAFANRFSLLVAPLDQRLRMTEPGTPVLVVSQEDAKRMTPSPLPYLEHVGGLWLVRGAVTTQFFRSPSSLLTLRHQGRQVDHLGALADQPPCAWRAHVRQVLLQGSTPQMRSSVQAAGYTVAWEHDRWSLWERQAQSACPASDR